MNKGTLKTQECIALQCAGLEAYYNAVYWLQRQENNGIEQSTSYLMVLGIILSDRQFFFLIGCNFRNILVY